MQRIKSKNHADYKSLYSISDELQIRQDGQFIFHFSFSKEMGYFAMK